MYFSSSIADKYSILFRRLKIIDLSKNANQPFLSNDGKIVLVFNGEIYNYLELKNELESGQENKSKGMMLTATLTEIRGGTSHNVTPKECVATLDIRIPVDMNCNDIEEKITKIINEMSIKREIEVLYSVIDETEPFEAAHNSPLVRALTLSILDVEKKRPMLIRKTGTGDMNVIGNQLKIPVITYGPGDPHEAHTIDEKVSIEEFVKGIEILKKSLHHSKRLHDRTK